MTLPISNLSRLDTIIRELGHPISDKEWQRLKETFHVCLLLNELGVAVGTQLKSNDPPGPDFYLQWEEEWVGLEETEAFPEVGDGRPRHFQVLRQMAVYEARKGYRASGAPPAIVHFYFNENIPYWGPQGKRDILDLAEKLEGLIHDSGWSELDGPNTKSFPGILPGGIRQVPEILRFWIRPCREDEPESWSIAGPARGDLLQPQRIQWELDQKKDKYPGYVNDHPRIWLLIANEGVQRGVPSHISEAASSSTYSFPFERAFWLDCTPPELTELEKR